MYTSNIEQRRVFYANGITMSKVVLEENGTAYYEKIDEHQNTVIVSDMNPYKLIRDNKRIPLG